MIEVEHRRVRRLSALALLIVLCSGGRIWAAEANPSPSAPERPGPYVLGANLPWIKYSLDVGASGYGEFGLSTDCGEGFRPQRHPEFPESHGVSRCARSSQRAHRGSFSLKASLRIAGNSAALPQSGEVATDLQDIADVVENFSIDLSGKTLTAWIYMDPGHRGDALHPNSVQLFVKDNSKNAVGLYSAASDDNGNIPAAGGWFQVHLTVDSGPPGFDPKHIRLLGVKIGIGEGSSAELNADVYIDQIEAAVPEAVFDFEQPSRAELDVERLSGAGVKAIRWFVFGDGRASPEFDSQGFVTGLDSRFFQDFDAMLELARKHDVFVVPVLFDFLLCGDRQEDQGVQLYGHASLIEDPARRQSFLVQALHPLLDRYGGAPEILAWEVINEPEWCLSDLALPVPRPGELPAGGAITTAEMQEFVREIASSLHDHPATYGDVVTLGSASSRYLDLWFGPDHDLGLDLCQFHFYDCPGCLDGGEPLPAHSSCALGEFATVESQTDRSVRQYLADTFTGGYWGALPWSWRGRDSASPVGWEQQAALLNGIREFAGSGPCLLSPTTLCLNQGRFAVQARWRAPDGKSGEAKAVQLTHDTGYFWFFQGDNVEMLIKVLDGCALNDRFWLFAGGLTDVEVEITVTDTLTGTVRSYKNSQGTAFQPIQDTGAFASCGSPARAQSVGLRAGDAAGALLLGDGRFKVTVDWATPQGVSGTGRAVQLTRDSGSFWFFGESNIELLVKVLNGCGVNDRYWVFAGGLTNVQTVVTVEDLVTGAVKRYTNLQGTAFRPLQDTNAFASCSPAL